MDPATDRSPPAISQQHWRQEKKPPPARPNYFLALQVSQHPEVVAAIQAIHAKLVQHSPHLQKACIEADTAHLTLGVMALNTKEKLRRAADVLAALAGPLAERALLVPIEVQLEGLSHFKKQVLYLDICKDGGLEKLMQLAGASREHFAKHGLLLQADQAFVPHVTVAKISKLQGSWGGNRGGQGHDRGSHGGRGSRAIPAEAWAPHASMVGGRALLGEIQLCAMQGRKPGQYYHVYCSLPLSPAAAASGKGGGDEAAAPLAGGFGEKVAAATAAGQNTALPGPPGS